MLRYRRFERCNMKACPRCLTAAAHWVTRVYAAGREVRLCVACSQAWEQRK